MRSYHASVKELILPENHSSGTASICFISILSRSLISTGILFATIVLSWTIVVSACPFCSSLPRTLSDDLEEGTSAVIARCESITEESDEVWILRLRITEVVKGDGDLQDSVVEAVTTERPSKNSIYWMVGFSETQIQWAPPTKISVGGVSYVKGLIGLNESGPKRLEYFLKYLQHPNEIIAADAYNEFAEASLEDIASLKNKLDRNWVISQLRDAKAPLHRRRLCWTFLSQCGVAQDRSLFDELVHRREIDGSFEIGMDAAIACFIVLGGEKALAQIERDYLTDSAARFSDSFSAISAIRVCGTEMRVIPRARLARALRPVLARPTLADLVISDLARWKDWTAIDRMVELFALPNEDARLIKPAVVLYLKNCPLPAAKNALAKLRKMDPEAVKSAEASMMLYTGLPSVPVPPPDESASKEEPE